MSRETLRLPVDRVTLSGEFSDLEASAEAFFRGLLAEGHVVRMGRQIRHDGELAGEPELRRAVDGLLFPITAAFDYEAAGCAYRVEMEARYNRQLYVRLTGPVVALEAMQRLLPGIELWCQAAAFAALKRTAAAAGKDPVELTEQDLAGICIMMEDLRASWGQVARAPSAL